MPTTVELGDNDWALIWRAEAEKLNIRIPVDMPPGSDVPPAGELMTAFMLRVSENDREFIDELLAWLDRRAPPRQ